MTQATRSTTARDFFIFQLKLVLDGIKDVVLFHLSIGAVIIDLVAGRGTRPRLFYGVMRLGEKVDLWLNLFGAAEAAEDDEDGLFGVSKAGSATMLGRLEQIVRGGDEPRSPRPNRSNQGSATAA